MTAPFTSNGTSAEQADRSRLRAFIEPRLPGVTLQDGADIFSLGLVSSLFAMELVFFIEKTIGIRIPDEELAIEHFRSIDSMTDLSARLRARPAVQDGP